MKVHLSDPKTIPTELQKLQARLEAAEVELSRITVRRGATKRKLDDLGRLLSDLKNDFALHAAGKAQSKT